MLVGANPQASLDHREAKRQLAATSARALLFAPVICIAWSAAFLILEQPSFALLLTVAALAFAGCWTISQRTCLSTAMLLAHGLCLAITATFCLAFDLPSEAVPRTSHGYFLVIAFAGYVEQRRKPRPALMVLIAIALCGFLAFSSRPFHFAFARPIADPVRTALAWLNSGTIVLLFCAGLFVLQRRALAGKAMARELTSTFANKRLEILLHPQVDRSRKIVGARAALVWNHPARGILAADVFMPVAVQEGLASQIDAWLLGQAVLTLSRWQLRSHTYDLVLSVDVSPEQLLLPDFVEGLAESMRSQGVHARHLRLELSGRTIAAELELSRQQLERLRAHGLSVALSEFGAGHGSLRNLQELPVQQLNLDGSFTRAASSDERSANLVRNMVNLGQALDLQVQARLIETEAQFEFMRACGCGTFEGTLFGEPLPAQDFDAYLHVTQHGVAAVENNSR